jgi:hypothetical protein
MDITYTIRSFDDVNKIVTVDFDDGSWASIGLMKPLPKDKLELEEAIKRYAKPKEAIEAKTNPDADLSYISSLIGISQTCERFSISIVKPIINKPTIEKIDTETEANLAMWEKIQFEKKIGEALVNLGVVTTNPATIPVTNV